MKFDWKHFTQKDLDELNDKKQETIYGWILVSTDIRGYLIDVRYVAKDTYNKNIICLSVFESNKGHGKWVAEIYDITTAHCYKRFVTRAEKAIIRVIEKWEKEN